MADEKKKVGNDNADTSNSDQPAAAKAVTQPDLVSEIGTLTYPRAVQQFGKENALAVLHRVAEIGGHGKFEDSDFLSPLFGGLQMPAGHSVTKPEKDAIAHLP